MTGPACFCFFMQRVIANLFPFIHTMKIYNLKKFRADLIAAMTVAIIALPQSMAYALIAGIDPKYGLYAATIPVIIASLFGSSRFLIAGPTNALAMMVASVTASAYVGGVLVNDMGDAEKIAIVFLLSFLAGLVQIFFGLAKFGSLINFISHSVVLAFTAGAGLLIAFNQLKNFFGLSFPAAHDFFHNLFEAIKHLPDLNPRAMGIGIFTLVFVVVAKKISKKIPGPLLAVMLSGVAVWALGWENELKLVGSIPRSLPPLSSWPLDFDTWRALISPALAIAILGIVEAMSIAKSLANLKGDRIDANQEIISQGMANVAASLTSGMPGTGSFTRSAVNFQAGAATRFAGVFSGLIVIIAIIALAPLSRYIPLASLAAMLMVISFGMIDRHGLVMAWRATKSDRIVIAITFFSTLLLELEKAVYVGVILSIFLFLRKASHPSVYKMVPKEKGGRLYTYEHGVPDCCQLNIFQIDGAFFFGAVSEIEDKLNHLSGDGSGIIIIRMKGVRLMDATGAHALETFIRSSQKKGIKVIMTNVKPGIREVMQRVGIDKLLGEMNITNDTTAALKLAMDKYIDPARCAACRKALFLECPK